MDRRRKAAPLPIFNKRPRQALLAHPNNVYSPSEVPNSGQDIYYGDCTAQGSCVQNFGPSRSDSRSQPTSYYNQPQARTWSNSHAASFEQENIPLSYQPPPRGAAKHPYPVHTTTCIPQGNGFIQPGYSISNSFTAEPKGSISMEWNKQPLKQNNATADVPETHGHTKIVRQELRTLTATSQGIQHWSKFHHTSCLLFEVFGSLNSAVTMEGPHAKQFVLKTSDGVVRCIFWEMDRLLPPLVRGHALRVVGNWDAHKAFLKCYSVRPSRSNEEQLIMPAIATSDRIMRQVTESAAET